MSPVRKTPVPEISVIIPSYNRSDQVVGLLKLLGEQTLSPDRFEVVVVDDCSTDDTFERIEELAPSLPYTLHPVRTPNNSGQPAAARNLGWRSSSAPLLAFLDDDVTPVPGWLEAGLAALHEQPRAGVIQGRTRPPDDQDMTHVEWGAPNWQVVHMIDQPSPWFESCNIFFRRKVMEDTGGFDDSISYWCEDTAAGWRALQAGWERGFAPEAEVTHPVDQRGWRWFLRKALLERNFVLLGVQYPDFRQDAFWRPWAFRREEAALVLAVAGAVVGLRFRPASLLVLPYVWLQCPKRYQPGYYRLLYQKPVLDAARLLGHLRGSLEQRTLVL